MGSPIQQTVFLLSKNQHNFNKKYYQRFGVGMRLFHLIIVNLSQSFKATFSLVLPVGMSLLSQELEWQSTGVHSADTAKTLQSVFWGCLPDLFCIFRTTISLVGHNIMLLQLDGLVSRTYFSGFFKRKTEM